MERVGHAGNPAAFVENLPITTLAEAAAGDGSFAYFECDGDTRFRCPVCRHCDHNGGTAELVDDLRWRCRRCELTRTRYFLERVVLEDADALGRSYRILEDEHVD